MMDFEQVVEIVANNEEMLLITGLVLFGVVATVAKSITSIVIGLSRERTKRDVAAYVAEGTMSPEQAQRLIDAGAKRTRCG